MLFLRLALLTLLTALPGCAGAPQQPPVQAFALMGDTPYSQAQANLLDSLIERVNEEPLAFAAHVGDITSGQGPCDDEWMLARKRQFERFRVPFVLLPGDNDWTDCHRTGFDPMERLAKWRELFCVPVALPGFVRQRGEHCEHARWELGNLVFAAVNVQGSNNNLGRTSAMDTEYERRMRDVFAWVDEAAARLRQGKTLVVVMQANPFLKPGSGRADGFRTIRERLAQLARAHAGRVILVHGDTHQYRDDEPMPGLRRIEVPGAPAVRWLRAIYSGERLQVEPADLP